MVSKKKNHSQLNSKNDNSSFNWKTNNASKYYEGEGGEMSLLLIIIM